MPAFKRFDKIQALNLGMIKLTSSYSSGPFSVSQMLPVMGSAVTPHPPCPKPGSHCHAYTKVDQFSVLVNGKPVVTTGSIDTCGHPRGVGSLDVIVGGL